METPPHDAQKIIQGLLKYHDKACSTMRKSKEYPTYEKRAAELIRWYSKKTMSFKSSKQACGIIRYQNKKIKVLWFFLVAALVALFLNFTLLWYLLYG